MEAPLQFGVREAGRDYPDRPAAFAVAERDGKIALALITRGDVAPYYDLPGGAIEAGETPEQAMVREFGEETGLVVRPLQPLTRADQFLIKTDGVGANNRTVIFAAEVLGDDAGLKIEADHQLVWMAPEEALRRIRHDSHAWGIAAWMRAIDRRTDVLLSP
ncbi:MAG: NUDIX domain-containing protein [Caulobacteraceae bacterium]